MHRSRLRRVEKLSDAACPEKAEGPLLIAVTERGGRTVHLWTGSPGTEDEMHVAIFVMYVEFVEAEDGRPA